MEGPGEYLRQHRDEVVRALSLENTKPSVFYRSSDYMEELADSSVQLVVTSPPYPMIEMWDRLFEKLLGIARGSFLNQSNSFHICHEFLGKVWSECHRVLDDGGILCINIGDATRSVSGNFRCYMNHTRVTEVCERIGFQSLVPILWNKPTNKPNAFLGSGFYPPNAYVTLDCEYILIFRKGPKRKVKPHDPLRYASQFSKKERDLWFSQTWDFRGTAQNQKDTAPFPDELPYRLIRMFSCLGNAVLDPFLGTGNTVRVARTLGRKGIGYEFNTSLKSVIERNLPLSAPNPEDVLDHLLSIYEVLKSVPSIAAAPKRGNLEDKTLSAFSRLLLALARYRSKLQFPTKPS